jgi:hypothetical protein
MRFVTPKRGIRLSWISILGIVCIALVLLTGILQVSHPQSSGHIDRDCSLCMTAHHVVQGVVVVTLELTSQPVVRFVADRFTPLPRQRFVLKLANRPPPVASVFA